MRGYLGVTDLDWYRFLHRQPGLDEVNFWQPSGGRAFRVLQPGEPFLFKLHAPHNAIAGFGLFARHSVLPDWLAWDAFAIGNGAPDLDTMRRRIVQYRATRPEPRAGGSQIGCIIVVEPVFFARDDWIPQPRDWPQPTVQGKTYDLEAGEGRRVWDACLERAQRQRPALLVGEGGPRFGAPGIVRPRLGQGGFRVAVTEAYGRACAVTSEHSLPVLEAAHIQSYSKGGAHSVANGLLLRTDIHRLFDQGYVTVTPEHRFRVSKDLREEWQNGRTYYELDGKEVSVPPGRGERPEPGLLAWHNEHCFRG